MPLQATSGAASYDAFGGGVAAVPQYIEDVFSTYLYTGNGATQTINNGIDLAGKGGLVWIKNRTGANDHSLEDTERVGTYAYTIASNTTALQSSGDITGFTLSGFSLRDYTGATNSSGYNYVAWTFRKQPKFFDVVTYTGNGTTNNISHNLQSIPGCIIIKSTSTTGDWAVICRDSYGSMYYQYFSKNTNGLNSTGAATGPYDSTAAINSTTFDASQLQDTGGSTNQNGVSYVAYLFAHNAGGFGLTGTDNVISCGSFTTDGGGNGSATLGYEPQWVLFKRTTGAQNWVLMDNMRNFVASPNDSSALYPNLSSAESVFGQIAPNATGFSGSNFSSSSTYIYIAIRRGPMKVPTSGTSVFSPVAANSGYDTFQTTGFPIDTQIVGFRNGLSLSQAVVDRLRGVSTVPSNTTYNSPLLSTSSTSAETTSNTSTNNWNNTGFSESLSLSMNDIYWNFRRAPSFFDEVCYTGTGTAQNITHNLGVAPELMIVKNRTGVSEWTTYQAPLGASQVMRLNSTIAAFTDASVWNGTAPTSSVFSVGTSARSNDAGSKFVIYLFATCAGVSKVGSYTGNGSTQTINCGFTGGARFVLIKAATAATEWFVFDTARGMTTGNDPVLFLNDTSAEINSFDLCDTTSVGFTIKYSGGFQGTNTSGVNYIFLAIA